MTAPATPAIPATPAAPEAQRNPIDRGGEIAEAQLAHVIAPPRRLARMRQLVMHWLGVVDVARVVKAIAFDISRFRDERLRDLERERNNVAVLRALRDVRDQESQVLMHVCERLAYYEANVPHLKRAKAEYEKLVRAIAEARGQVPPPTTAAAPAPPAPSGAPGDAAPTVAPDATPDATPDAAAAPQPADSVTAPPR